MAVLTALLVILATLVGYLIYKAHKINQTWKERGIPHKKPLLFIGNSLNTVLGRGGILSINRQEVYKLFPNAPLVGYYEFSDPCLMVKDIELVKRVLVRDFSYFPNRGVHEFPNDLTNVGDSSGKKWKYLRHKLLPLFTTGKMKIMFDQMSKISEYLLESINNGSEKEIKGIVLNDYFNGYSIDVLGVIIFGMDIGTLRDGNHELVEMANKLFTWNHAIRWSLWIRFPNFCERFGISHGLPSVVQYFNGIIRQTIALREATGVKRHDFVNLMMSMKEEGHSEMVKEEGQNNVNLADDSLPDNEKVDLSQLLTMFCYDMSQNLHAQDKLREEIKNSMAARNGVFSFDVIQGMKYLEMCLKESMRMHPISGTLLRECAKEYTFPGTNFTVKPGESVQIPVYCIHNDPDVFPEPERFIPERFAPEASHLKCAWLPLGDGPRACIALRFVMMEAKVAIIKMLLNYEITLNSKTILPLRQSPRVVLYQTAEPVYFDLKKIS